MDIIVLQVRDAADRYGRLKGSGKRAKPNPFSVAVSAIPTA
jgi:hypothetical protein